MKAKQLKANQGELKERYLANPDDANQTLEASGFVDFGNLSFVIESPTNLSPAGLHVASGGDGTFACSVEILLAGWVGCVGTTLAAVAHSMKLDITSCRIVASGDMDFRGTLGVDREAPVGLTGLRLDFDFDSQEESEKIEKLIKLTERYCVVHQTFLHPPTIEISISNSNN